MDFTKGKLFIKIKVLNLNHAVKKRMPKLDKLTCS